MTICALAPAGALGQHIHGVIELGVVVEGSTVAVSLDAPLSDVVGFEHAPESDEQLERIRQAATMLSNPDAMFGLADSAECAISDTSIDGPAYVLEHLGDDDAGAELSDHDHHDEHEESAAHDHHDEHEESAAHDHDDEHDEPAAHDHHDEHEESADHDHHDEHEESADHDHDGHEESADHEHDDAEQHSEVNANYQWECRSASDLDSLALRFTESFAGVETIEIQILTSAGAQVLTVEGRAKSVSLSRP
ncbi:MAG: DUF2796 domain-containing protein [Gammaproteobacteria bacterium]|nr:DUF2796 domain-containing protein [Gammaproteobacteria bacterium]